MSNFFFSSHSALCFTSDSHHTSPFASPLDFPHIVAPSQAGGSEPTSWWLGFLRISRRNRTWSLSLLPSLNGASLSTIQHPRQTSGTNPLTAQSSTRYGRLKSHHPPTQFTFKATLSFPASSVCPLSKNGSVQLTGKEDWAPVSKPENTVGRQSPGFQILNHSSLTIQSRGLARGSF